MKNNNLLKKILVSVFVITANSCFAQGPFNIGTINAGDSIVIIYDVTINNPLVPPNAPSISNQGTVSGGNFSNVLTDDPDTGTGSDATITLLNMFPVPVTLTTFSAYQRSSAIELAWEVTTEINVAVYEIQKSSDGRNFLPIGIKTATGGNGIINYNFQDLNPFTGNNFYRLKMIDISGQFKFSSIVNVKISDGKDVFRLFPNPVQNGTVVLQMESVTAGDYSLDLFNSTGQVVRKIKIKHSGGSASQTISLNNLSAGIYNLSITGTDKVIYKKIVIL